MKIRGYTLTELVVVCSILVVLAAVLTPVIMRVKEAAKESVCASNLHELWAAVALYRERYEGAPAYGNAYAMGLPFHPGDMAHELGLPDAIGVCSGFKPAPGLPARYVYMVATPKTQNHYLLTIWAQYSKEVGEHMILFVDPNHMPPSEQNSPYTHKRVQGVYLDGQLKKFVKLGDWNAYDFWK